VLIVPLVHLLQKTEDYFDSKSITVLSPFGANMHKIVQRLRELTVRRGGKGKKEKRKEGEGGKGMEGKVASS